MALSRLWFVEEILAQDSKVQDAASAVESAHVSGWDLLAAALVLIAAYPVGRLAQRLIKRAFKKTPGKVPPALVYEVSQGVRSLIWVSAGAIALTLVGVGTNWIALVVVVLLVVVALIARPRIENTAAGLTLTMRPSFGVGDQVEVLGTRGKVLEIGSHSTVLEATDGAKSYIPNHILLNQSVRVYSANDAMRAEFEISLQAGTDIAKAIGIISKALTTADHLVSDPAPDVVAVGLDQDAMIVRARIWYPSTLKSATSPVSAAILAVRGALDGAGITLGGASDSIDAVVTSHVDAVDKGSGSKKTSSGDDAPDTDSNGSDTT